MTSLSRNIHRAFLLGALCLTAAGCDDWTSLTIPPQTILTDDRVWGDPNMIRGVLADYYGRLPFHQSLTGGNGQNFTSYDEAIWSAADNGEAANSHITYAYNRWTLWQGNSGYGLIRDINLAIDGIEASQSTTLTPALKTQFVAEMRFIRALVYFELVKRMGGVPIITEQLLYDFSGDPTPLQRARNTEAEVYDFIHSELTLIKDQLGNAGVPQRANKGSALALMSRAMLYAGSLARHNNERPDPITLPGGIVGISAGQAADYYTKSLAASRELINSGLYQLYRVNPDLGENFYEAITRKSGNTEVILVTDYNAAQGYAHSFTRSTIPRGLRRDVFQVFGGSSTSPTLQLVESYDRLNGDPGTFTGVGDGTVAGQANWQYFDQPGDIFVGRDARLYGTVILPGSSFAGEAIRLQAGVYVWNAGTNRYDRVTGTLNSTYVDGETLTGQDGPNTVDSYVSTTGFLLRKYLDTAPGARSTSIDSDIWWVWFRLGEVYLNAAEAALELGLQGEAVGYVNTLRERAGFPPNSLASLDRARLRNERRVELAFEDHRLWDLIRWRIADQVWDGTAGSLTANSYSLYGYRIYRPGHPNHGKFVYDRIRSARQTQPRNFRVGNYYSEVPNAVINANPLIVRNPFH